MYHHALNMRTSRYINIESNGRLILWRYYFIDCGNSMWRLWLLFVYVVVHIHFSQLKNYFIYIGYFYQCLQQWLVSYTGSTFPKAKPHSGVWLAGLHGIIRIIFLPLYSHWWICETSCAGFLGVLSIYCSILFCGAVMITNRHNEAIIKVSTQLLIVLSCS